MYNYIHTALCADYQDGQYRVQNGTVLQECVDQQWTIVENTNQLLTLVQQDIDQLINEALNTQCPSTPPTTIQSTQSSSEVGSTTTHLAVIVILAVILLLTVTGWIITCVVVWKKNIKYNHKQR